jgi:hypothetical protein
MCDNAQYREMKRGRGGGEFVRKRMRRGQTNHPCGITSHELLLRLQPRLSLRNATPAQAWYGVTSSFMLFLPRKREENREERERKPALKRSHPNPQSFTYKKRKKAVRMV